MFRFRRSDHKVVVADMLVGVGRYDAYEKANRAVQSFLAKIDNKDHSAKWFRHPY
jgi:hypothetical protein